MGSESNGNLRSLLASAAKSFRHSLSPSSRFSALLAITSDAGGGAASAAGVAPAELSDGPFPSTKRLARSVEPNFPQIGDMPPKPPTFRGRVGGLLIRIMRRALFWYTAQIKRFQSSVADAAREQMLALQEIGAYQGQQQTQLTELVRKVGQLEGQIQELQEARNTRLQSVTEALEEGRHHRETLDARLDQLAAANAAHQQDVGSVIGQLHKQLDSSLKEIRQGLHFANVQLTQHDLRVKMFTAETRRPASLEDTRITPGLEREMSHIYDQLFTHHSDLFRGARLDIQQRLLVYVPSASDAYTAAGRAPALDLGCGRGEWLEVLAGAEIPIPASGVDRNREFVGQCRERGLDAIEANISDFLASVPSESRSIVTAFHVLEHLPFDELVYILDQSVRILKPGGIVIFETPHPRNLHVSTHNFYLDPTHLHPLPSELLSFLIEARGLCEPTVIPLSPYPEYLRLPASDCAAVQFINDHFFGCQDYGIVARKA